MKLVFIINKQEDIKFALNKKEKEFIEEQYSTCLNFIEYSRQAYQKSWNQINNDFSRYIEQTTGYVWKHKKYYCVVSANHEGGNSNQIMRWWKDNPYTQRRITAHELIISHYFTIIQGNYSHEKLTNKQIWQLAEIAAWALTSLTPEVKKFWPWDKSGYYYNHNYPQFVPMQKNLKNVFIKRKKFDEYIQKGILLIRPANVLDYQVIEEICPQNCMVFMDKQ